MQSPIIVGGTKLMQIDVKKPVLWYQIPPVEIVIAYDLICFSI